MESPYPKITDHQQLDHDPRVLKPDFVEQLRGAGLRFRTLGFGVSYNVEQQTFIPRSSPSYFDMAADEIETLRTICANLHNETPEAKAEWLNYLKERKLDNG